MLLLLLLVPESPRTCSGVYSKRWVCFIAPISSGFRINSTDVTDNEYFYQPQDPLEPICHSDGSWATLEVAINNCPFEFKVWCSSFGSPASTLQGPLVPQVTLKWRGSYDSFDFVPSLPGLVPGSPPNDRYASLLLPLRIAVYQKWILCSRSIFSYTSKLHTPHTHYISGFVSSRHRVSCAPVPGTSEDEEHRDLCLNRIHIHLEQFHARMSPV